MRSRFTRTCLLLLAGVVVAFGVAGAAFAQTPAASPVAQDTAELHADSTVELQFPVGMTVTAELTWDNTLQPDEVSLTYTVATDPTEHLAAVATTLDPNVETASATATLDLQNPFVPSGIQVWFTWRLERENVVIARSAPTQTPWTDSRWDWSTDSSDQIRVHSYALSESFAGEIRDSAQSAVTELEQRFGLERSAPLDIWVYATIDDLLGAQQANTRESIAGASYPGYDLIVALIPEGSESEIGRIIPHEVSHQVLYQATQNPFTYPPIWFDEGMATHMQVGGTDNYPQMVANALDNGELFQLTSLEVTFPYTPAQATLAYASSWSAIQYIQETYGDDGIAALIDAFGRGLSNDEAVKLALGVDVSELSANWHEWVSQQKNQ